MSDGKVTALSADSCESGATVGSSWRVAVSSGAAGAGRGAARAVGSAAALAGGAVGAGGVAVGAVRAIANAATAPSKPNEMTQRVRVLMLTSVLLGVASDTKADRGADALFGIAPGEAELGHRRGFPVGPTHDVPCAVVRTQRVGHGHVVDE